MAGSNKRWRQRWFMSWQEWCFKEDDKWQCVSGIDFIMFCECVRSCKLYQKLRLACGFELAKSTRMVTLQDVPLLNVTSGRPYAMAEVTILVISQKLPKIATSNIIFSRTADCIAAKFCMTRLTSYVILRLLCKRMVGNLGCTSAVIQSLKSSWGFRVLISCNGIEHTIKAVARKKMQKFYVLDICICNYEFDILHIMWFNGGIILPLPVLVTRKASGIDSLVTVVI